MATERKFVSAVYTAGYTSYDGLDTWRVMPTRNVPIELLEPFIFLNHHGPQVYPPQNEGLPFGPHPHKGFETVTFILDGELVHQDSTGYKSKIKAGGIQWMTAGSGIIHSETSSAQFRETGGAIELLQLWVNLPARLKETSPAYQGLQAGQVPVKILQDGQVHLQPVSGTWEGEQAPIQSISDVHLATVKIAAGTKWSFSVAANRRVLYYVIRGKVSVNGTTAETHDLVEMASGGNMVESEAITDTLLLVGHAQPNDEPVVAHGPFVMNTHAEIREAFVQYQNGALGVWPD